MVFSLIALLGYWAVMAFGGDYTLTGNAVLRLDRWLLGDAHLYHGEGLAFDPEGLLSTVPAIVNTIAGYLTGRFLLTRGASYETIARMMMVGAILVTGAMAWNPVFPINKKIWTSSFVLLTVGIDLFVLSILVYLIEIRQLRRWTYFFEVFGRNTLALYLLSELGVTVLYVIRVGDQSAYRAIYSGGFRPVAGDYLGSLLFAVSWMGICWLAGYWLDRRGVYIRA